MLRPVPCRRLVQQKIPNGLTCLGSSIRNSVHRTKRMIARIMRVDQRVACMDFGGPQPLVGNRITAAAAFCAVLYLHLMPKSIETGIVYSRVVEDSERAAQCVCTLFRCVHPFDLIFTLIYYDLGNECIAYGCSGLDRWTCLFI